MNRPLIRVDDPTSHGGKPTARDGDTTACGATLKAPQDHDFIQ